MGRNKRDKGFDGGPSKRKAILQIEKPSLKAGQKESKSNGGTNQPQKAHNPLGLLASYGDSDDDDDDTDEEEASVQGKQQQQAKGGFIGVGGAKPENEMDGMVADFLAEIDALDPEATPEQPSEPAAANQEPQQPQQTDEPSSSEQAPQPAATEDNGGWQELLDETTNCIYYWNTITNDVTWETPAEFNQAAASSPAAATVPSEPTSQASSGRSTPVLPNSSEIVASVVPEEATPVVEIPKVELKKAAMTEPSVLPKEVLVKEEAPVKKKEEVLIKKMISKPAVVKPPVVVDMFADEEMEQEKDFLEEKATEKMPIYGTLKVEYEISPREEDEDEESDEVEEEPEPPPPKVKKTMYSMFVKGDSLPPSKDLEMETTVEKAKKPPVLGHDLGLEENEELSLVGAAVAGRGLGFGGGGRGDDAELEDEVVEDDDDDDGNDDDDDDDVVEMDAGDDIDIDQQLELALERKKAELAELEEMENSGSQSPAQKRKTASPLNLYDEKGEVNLLSFKKKRLENLRNQQQSQQQRQTCDQETQCDEQLIEKMAEDYEKGKTVKTIKEEVKLKAELSDLGSTLVSKLEFLGQATSKGLSKLQVLLVEIETRILDWREGALDGKHLLRKLQIADWELERYESEAAPPNWTCSWNRTHRQYFYTNSATGDSQWDYPIEALPKDELRREELTLDEKESRAMFNRASSQDDSTLKDTSGGGRTSAMMHGNIVDVQLNLQANTSRPQSPSPSPPSPDPPPPPIPDDAPPLPRDPPPPGTGPDLPPLPPSPPPPPPTPPEYSDDDDEASTGGSSRPFTPPPPPPTVPPSFGASGAPSIFDQQPPPPPETDGTVIGKPQILYTNPAVPASGLDGTPIGDYGRAAVVYGTAPVLGPGEEPAGGVQAPPSTTQQAPAKTKKTKKVKKSSAVKKKMPSSLVEKWKQIQEAQAREEEEKRQREEEEDMVVDPNLIQQKRIAEWKKQQMEAGRASYNPNFEMIKGDWRERLKRKGSKQ